MIKSYVLISCLFTFTIINGRIVQITNSGQFEQEVTNSNQPAVVKFYADWCGPCKVAQQPFEEVSTMPEFEHVTFVTVNADKVPALLDKFSVNNLPTFMFIKGSTIKQKTAGLLDAMDATGFKNNLIQTLRKLFPTQAEQQEETEEVEPTVPDEQDTGLWTRIQQWFSGLLVTVKQCFSSLGSTISSCFIN